MITLEAIKKDYPNSITSDMNEGRIKKWLEELPDDKKTVTPWNEEWHSHLVSYIGDDVIETDEPYPQCNYCVGGALQMALGKESNNVNTVSLSTIRGNFPSVDSLAETLQDQFKMPYGTAYNFADNIISKNDAGRFQEAWFLVEQAINWGRRFNA